MLPSAARASSRSAGGSKSIPSAASTPTKRSPICSGSNRLRLNWRQRESTVAGSFCGSVVASTNFTCGGGSSKVFSSALKLLAENMCTSSIR